MNIQQIPQVAGGFGAGIGTPSGNNVGAAAANFADSLAAASGDAPPTPQEIRTAQTAHMYARIAEVGLQRYAVEEQQMKKMLRVLTIVSGESPPDVQGVLAGTTNDFLRDPPNGLQDMYSRISAVVARIPQDSTNLRGRMEAVVKQIHQMMDESDEALARRERAANLATTLGG
jgi:hypothetical protein